MADLHDFGLDLPDGDTPPLFEVSLALSAAA